MLWRGVELAATPKIVEFAVDRRLTAVDLHIAFRKPAANAVRSASNASSPPHLTLLENLDRFAARKRKLVWISPPPRERRGAGRDDDVRAVAAVRLECRCRWLRGSCCGRLVSRRRIVERKRRIRLVRNRFLAGWRLRARRRRRL